MKKNENEITNELLEAVKSIRQLAKQYYPDATYMAVTCVDDHYFSIFVAKDTTASEFYVNAWESPSGTRMAQSPNGKYDFLPGYGPDDVEEKDE